MSAFLTIAGYSINDTIVIFDRMRELEELPPRALEVINRAINETLSRTIITNGTIFTVVMILFLLGGKVIHNFAMAMVFGAVVGTYSTIAIAAPMVRVYSRTGRVRSPPVEAGRRQNPQAVGRVKKIGASSFRSGPRRSTVAKRRDSTSPLSACSRPLRADLTHSPPPA